MYYMGGKLAYWFGITSPDWQYAVDVYQDMKREVSQPWDVAGVEGITFQHWPPLLSWLVQEERERREEEELIAEMKERVSRKMAAMEEAADLPAHADEADTVQP